jgi:hypothetical protein
MISAPSIEEHPAVIADWLELTAIAAQSGQSRIFAIADVRDITQDEESEDVGDFDAGNDAIIGRVTTEIISRKEALQDAYPFEVDPSGRVLSVVNGNADRLGGLVYLACLFMSHVNKSVLLEQFDLASNAQAGRSVFQICSVLAASGWCGGPAISFGWPRLDRSNFAAKLSETYKLFGDGTPRKEPLAAAPAHIKDGGIDVIAWKQTQDGLPGTVYLLGQVASGLNWKDKSVLTDIDSFHWGWFEVQPASPPTGAMFMPFCITDPEETGDFTEQEVRVNRMQALTKQFGIFQYRYRLPLHADQAIAVHAAGVRPVEGFAEIGLIERWVADFTEKLRATNS